MDICKELATVIQTIVSKMNVSFWKDLSGIIQSLLTSAGIIIAGVWTYLLFIRQRLHFPKVKINLSVTDTILPNENRLVHAEIKIENVGSVILCSDYAELRLRQVVPVPKEINTIIEDGKDPVQLGNSEIVWPMLFNREWKWESKCFEIEPGEPDSLHADYIIPEDIKVIEFYCFIANAKKKRHGLGWAVTQLHELNLMGGKMAEKTQKDGDKTIKKINEQQRQQKQQQQQQQQQQEKPKKKSRMP